MRLLNCAVDYTCTGFRRSLTLAVVIESFLKVIDRGIFFNKQLQKQKTLF